MKLIVMGVSGCGKTTVGRALAVRLGLPFIEGDNLHPPANIKKMASGTPLTDEDRWPWLDSLAAAMREAGDCIASCSALKRAYRDRLRQGLGDGVRFVHLKADYDIIHQRMNRPGHFFPAALLRSQFEALEPPGEDEAVIVDATRPARELVEAVAQSV